MTKGKLILIVIVVAVVANYIGYVLVLESPYSTSPFEHGLWTLITGISFALVVICTIIYMAIYIIEHWNDKL